MRNLPLLLVCLLLPVAYSYIECRQFSYHPIDETYDEVQTECRDYCVKYAVTMYMQETSKMTFFLGNCDDGHFCRGEWDSFNRTLSPRAYKRILGGRLPPTVTKVKIQGNCCTRDNCNRF